MKTIEELYEELARLIDEADFVSRRHSKLDVYPIINKAIIHIDLDLSTTRAGSKQKRFTRQDTSHDFDKDNS